MTVCLDSGHFTTPTYSAGDGNGFLNGVCVS